MTDQLIIHMGQHKTGSTYIQATANNNHLLLGACGVYYQPVSGYPAHNETAWPLLRGDFTPLERMVEAGRKTGCTIMLFSAEDLSGLMIRPDLVERMRIFSQRMNLSLSYHMYLRSQEELFWSQYSEIAKVYFIDPLYLFSQIMRRGCHLYTNLDGVDGDNRPPFWFVCFDNLKYIERFARWVEDALYIYDFAEPGPFPGWRLLEFCGIPIEKLALPGEWARNQRFSEEATKENYIRRLRENLPPGAESEVLASSIVEHSWMDESMRQKISQALIRRFGGQNKLLFKKFGGNTDMQSKEIR